MLIAQVRDASDKGPRGLAGCSQPAIRQTRQLTGTSSLDLASRPDLPETSSDSPNAGADPDADFSFNESSPELTA